MQERQYLCIDQKSLYATVECVARGLDPMTTNLVVADGKASRLRNHGITTMREVAMMDEGYLYDWFGIDAELLIDHAWGRESTTIADIKAYRSKSKSLSSGQVLMRDYKYKEGVVIAKEMMEQLCLYRQ